MKADFVNFRVSHFSQKVKQNHYNIMINKEKCTLTPCRQVDTSLYLSEDKKYVC